MISDRMIQGAKLYALADRTDPFAYNRAMSHLENGICGFNDAGQDAFYNARPVQITCHYTDENGHKVSYSITEYRDIIRP